MADKFLCALATFDEEGVARIGQIEQVIGDAGIVGKQTQGLPPHITLATFDVSQEDEIAQMLQDVCSKTRSLDLAFNHVGLFGLGVLFLAPDVTHELLELREAFDGYCLKSNKGWTPHVTLLIDEAESVHRALPLVAQSFQQLHARVDRVSLYEFFPTRLVAEYSLQQ